MFQLSTSCPLGGVLYPWRYWTAVLKESPTVELDSSSPLVRNFAPNQFGSRILPAPSGRRGSVVAFNTEASDAHFVASP